MSKQDNNRNRKVTETLSVNGSNFSVYPDVGKKTAETRCSFIKKRNKMRQYQTKK